MFMPQKKHIFYWLHGIIMTAGISVSTLFIYGAVSGTDRGHPPAIIFLPVVVIAWLILHLFLIFIQWLASRTDANTPWPVSLVILVVLCSVNSLLGLTTLLSMVYSGRFPVYVTQWISLLIFGFSFICLCGILLRKNWGRLMAGSACILIPGYYTYRTIRAVASGYNFTIGSAIYLTILVGGLGLFGYHLLRSERIKLFFENN